jgi:putative acetyltransferase
MIDAIRASDGFVPELSLVAEHDGKIVGHVLLSYVQLGAIPLAAYDPGIRGRVEFPPAYSVA